MTLGNRLSASVLRRAREARINATAATLPIIGPRKWAPRHSLPGELIVSLTSYPARFRTLHLTLICLLRQTVRADRTILWVAHEDAAHLPTEVLRLKPWGLEIYTTSDTRSYKKVVPTLRKHPEAFIATADDDQFYRENWLQQLTSGFLQSGRLIVCHRGHRPLLDPEGRLVPYYNWVWNVQAPIASTLLFPTGVGGVLYPPGALDPDVLNEDKFMEFCPTADDVWLYFMGRKRGTKYRTVGSGFKLAPWKGSQDTSLWSTNLDASANDSQISRMQIEYGLLPN